MSTLDPPSTQTTNPLVALPYEPALESLGDDYYDIVAAAEFPQQILRFRNDALLPLFGLDRDTVSHDDFINAFGRFQGRWPLLALRYHGYQFGEYNPYLGDGRGFLYGQLRGTDGELYDLGTKGSGTTPYSRGGDGRLTLKGGVREVLAAEMLHRLGVRTSRCLSLIETGEALWRGDEPSPTRSSVMVRLSRSHIRFGTFERLHYLRRPDLIQRLLDHVMACYYPHLAHQPDAYARFYAELVQRTADLVAQWMAAGFCHGVLNTDNMSITGESFDYGPYAFIDRYNLQFTAAYFDHFGRYAYGNQPLICRWNLEMLHAPLQAVIAPADLDAALSHYEAHYQSAYRRYMLRKLGVESLAGDLAEELVKLTLRLLQATQIGYHDFFWALRRQFLPEWRDRPELILAESVSSQADALVNSFKQWRQGYHQALNQLDVSAMGAIAQCLDRYNPETVIVRPEIEAVWEPIALHHDWQPFYDLLERIRLSE